MGTLRSLSVTQQVGLLFVVLFGLLLLTTAVTMTRSLRDPTDIEVERRLRFRRDLGAVWNGTLAFWLAWVSGSGRALPW